MNVETCIGKCGTDVNWTYMVFHNHNVENPWCDQNEIILNSAVVRVDLGSYFTSYRIVRSYKVSTLAMRKIPVVLIPQLSIVRRIQFLNGRA